MTKSQYKQYLKAIRNLSDRTVGHYMTSLNTISKILVEQGDLKESIYEVDSFNRLLELKQILLADEMFVNKDKIGHNMYSAGLNNYLRFAEGNDFAKTDVSIEVMDIKANIQKVSQTKSGYKRDRIITKQVLAYNDYCCEVDHFHETFIAEATKHRYMEGHHMIPMKKQDVFECSLDVYANVISVCPVCHRLLHHGLQDDKINILNMLYQQKADRMYESGIVVSKNEFVDLALH